MAHFYGLLKGTRGEATRCGGKNSGLTTKAAGWKGAIVTQVWFDVESNVDRYRLLLVPWKGSSGSSRVLGEGVLDSSSEDSDG